MMQITRLFLKDQRASTAAEFAMVLPLALMFLLGMIDVGRFMWTVNKEEKATQMGTRFAVVTAPVPTGLAGFSFVGTSSLVAGDTVPSSAYGTMTCGTTTAAGAATCTCASGSTCPWGATATAASFTAIYDRMKLFLPEVGRQHVKVEYAPSGLGYAGDPTGPDIYPVVTIRLQGMAFKPITTQLFNLSMPMPDASFSLTMEDSVGTDSN